MMHQVRPDYTLVSALSATVHESPTPTFATAKWEDLASNLPPYEHLRARTFGDKVVHHRSSWVNRMRADSLDAFIKTYEYYLIKLFLRKIFYISLVFFSLIFISVKLIEYPCCLHL